MAGSYKPGSLGTEPARQNLNDGTHARILTPQPGLIGLKHTTPATDASKIAANNSEIEALRLAPTARLAAYTLKKAHPALKFTSGRRNKEDQARAMASNVVKNRQWIEQTYRKSSLRNACQDWVDNNSEKTTQSEIQQGLLSVFNNASDEELGKFSKHLSGMAFDVQPVTTDAENIKKTIRSLVGLDKFLEKEGGLVRWHVQF